MKRSKNLIEKSRCAKVFIQTSHLFWAYISNLLKSCGQTTFQELQEVKTMFYETYQINCKRSLAGGYPAGWLPIQMIFATACQSVTKVPQD